MLAYMVNVLLVGTYSLIYNLWFKGNLRVKLVFICIVTLQLILLLGLKSEFLGADMQNYWVYYEEQLRWNLMSLADERFEIGFKALTKLVTLITENPQVYLLVIASLSIIPVSIVIYKYSKMPFLSLLLYVFLGFYSFNFSGLRQAIALGVIFIAYNFLVSKRPLKFIATIAIATCFHFSAIAFLPAYFLGRFKFDPRGFALFLIVAILILTLNAQILVWLTSFLYQDFSVVVTNSYTWMAMSVIIFLACMQYYREAIKSDSKNIALYALVGVGVALMLFAPVADNVMRIANYYFIFTILLVPAVLIEVRRPKMRAVLTSAVLCVFMAVYVYLLNIDGYSIVPYQFFWEPTGQYEASIR